MSRIYASPGRVYLLLAVLALVGIFSGTRLPVSLYPNSSKPSINVSVGYGDANAEDFMRLYGSGLESQLRGINTESLEVETIRASYMRGSVSYTVKFKWGSPSKTALREVQSVATAYAARMPIEMRDSMSVNARNDNSGFLAVSFASSVRSLDEVYKLLEPSIMPAISKLPDAENPGIWNPSSKEIRIELIPERMAAMQLVPSHIARAVESSLQGFSGGTIVSGMQQFTVQMPKITQRIEDLIAIPVRTPSGQTVHLGDVAKVDFGPVTEGNQILKTSGAPSLILWVAPKPGGNIKRMAEDALQIVREAAPKLPKDIEYKVVVDPSQFIRNAIDNVFHEVGIGAFLAVVVLFLFIGSLRNVITAAIEIPMSMVLAFILMRMSGMNLNLISLGGLALSAGMNVDASVVVMENIFRHFEELPKGTRLDYAGKLKVISQAVAEVRFAVIASTIASLVVFIPLAFTSDLTYAILGDLAKTVVFSHGFSAFVALLLVPTVRLHLMSRSKGEHKPVHSPIEPQIRKLEEAYGEALRRFINSNKARWLTYAGAAATLALLVAFALPRLPREIVGKPDTEMMDLNVNTNGNTLINQMEGTADEVEARLLKKFGSRIHYTFTSIFGPNGAWIMARLKDKSEMRQFWKDLEAEFVNTPFMTFNVSPWNPAELPIPNPPDMRIVVRGGSVEERAEAARQIKNQLEEKRAFPRIWADPGVDRTQSVVIRPNIEQWAALQRSGSAISPGDLVDFTRVATDGRKVGTMSIDQRDTNLYMRYPRGYATTAEDLGALPIGVGPKVIPLKALARVGIEDVPPTLYREDEHDLFIIVGRKNEADDNSVVDKGLKIAEQVVTDWNAKAAQGGKSASAYLDDAQIDLHEALRQLGTAVALSIALIFLTLMIQFGSVVNALLVLVAVPLGLIGVMLALFVFKSTLSLNSALGVILLNGIAVANSIILVDFLKRQVDQGMAPLEAAVLAGKKRLRPILITSLTTILGMLPIAIGMGDGGRILQPLGIAVSGGLWVSMGLTLFIVPALQVSYLNWVASRRKPTDLAPQMAFVSGALVADEIAAEAFGDALIASRKHSPSHQETLQ